MATKPFVLGDILNPDYAESPNTPVISKQSPLEMLVQTCNNVGKELHGDSLGGCDVKKTALGVRTKAKDASRNGAYALATDCEAHERALRGDLCNPIVRLESLTASLSQQLRGVSPARKVHPQLQSHPPQLQPASDSVPLPTGLPEAGNPYQALYNFLLATQSRAPGNYTPFVDCAPYPGSCGLPLAPQAAPAALGRPEALFHTPEVNTATQHPSVWSCLAALSQLNQLRQLKTAPAPPTLAPPQHVEPAVDCSQALAACLAYGYQQPPAAYLASLAKMKAEQAAADCGPSRVCNWMISGNENRVRAFCGAKFCTSEQLMQHLKLHIAEDQNEADHRAGLEDRRRSAKRSRTAADDDDLDAAVPKSIRSDTGSSRKLRDTVESKCFASPSTSTDSDK